MNIKVSIPVTHGDYTGQRDQWEEYTRDYEVEAYADIVNLVGPDQSKITFNLNELLDARSMLTELAKSATVTQP